MIKMCPSKPNLIIVNAEVWTLETPDEAWDEITAVAISGNRILALGTDAEIRALSDGTAAVVNAGGRTLIPGIVDAHTHFQVAAIQRHLYVDFSVTSPADLRDVLAAMCTRVSATQPGEWVRGDGLRHLELAEQRFPTRAELDALSTEHPIVLVGQGHHAVAANSMALAIAGIDEYTADPPGGKLEREVSGRLNGILVERGKLRLDPFAYDTVVPICTSEERSASLQEAFRHAHSFGITGIHDVLADPLEVTSYIEMKNAGTLGLRVKMLLRAVGTETKIPLEYLAGLGLIHGLGDEWLRFDGVKMSVDGSHYHRAAATYEPYIGQPDNFGEVRIDQKQLDDAVSRCHNLGVRAVVHAVGPRAVDMTCKSFEIAIERFGKKPIRHRIEHAFLPPFANQLNRIAGLGLTISTQAALIRDAKAMTEVFGADSLQGVLALRDMLAMGIPVLAGTDFPGVPINPFVGIGFAVNRLAIDGRLIDESQAISLWKSLALYTKNAAWSSYQDHIVGTLTPGKLADLVLLDRPLRNTRADELNEVQADLTILDGVPVYDRHSAIR